MLERFASEVRRAVAEAEAEARALDAPAVGSEHLLLVVADRCGVLLAFPCPPFLGWPATLITKDAVRARLQAEQRDTLAAIGISLNALRDGIGEDEWRLADPDDRLPFNREARDALQGALRAALELRSRRVMLPHLIIALMRQRGRASDVFRTVGGDPELVERRLVSELSGLYSVALG